MKKLLVFVLVGFLIAGCWPFVQNGEPPGPTYVGDTNETPDAQGNRTLHINQPTDCRCPAVNGIIQGGGAVYFDELDAAHHEHFRNHCQACSTMGRHCGQLFQ